MDRFEQVREQKLRENLTVVRFVSLIMVFIALISYLKVDVASTYIGLSLFPFLLILVWCVWYIWQFIIKRGGQLFSTKVGIIDYLQTICSVFIISVILYMTGGVNSRFGNLYFVPIIVTAIRYGSKMGLIAAAVAGGNLISFNLFFINQEDMTLEPALVNVGIFLISAWLIGGIMDMELDIRRQLAILATRDENTGLYNHRFFQERLEKELMQAAVEKYAVVLAMIDIDNFKAYNDTFGHQAGDQVLQKVAQIINTNIRESDLPARYGGEEFAIIMPQTDIKSAAMVTEGIRLQVQKSFGGITGLDKSIGKITISVGLAEFPKDASSRNTLIKRADEALFQAKYISRNRVMFYHSVLDKLRDELDSSELSIIDTVKTFLSIINAKDKYTYGHAGRVLNYASMLAQAVGITSRDLNVLQYAAYLHDIGKIEIDADLLNKTGRLTEEEWNILKEHPRIGAELINNIKTLDPVRPCVLLHHERWDGTGYPYGLKGKEIPLNVRVLNIADAFDAMTTDRPYKKGKTLAEARVELEYQAGVQFDPDLVAVFLRLLEGKKETKELLVESFVGSSAQGY
ncbi:MAG: diguanylate cyclase [bacterium]|jgi:diguanylate cyclase (GGDEF)-like protein/putative nucleotidyltransferase with HDIG domain